MFRPFLDIQPPKPNPDCPGRDQDDPMPISPKLNCSLNKQRQVRQQRLVSLFVTDGRSSYKKGIVLPPRQPPRTEGGKEVRQKTRKDKPSLMTIVKARFPFTFVEDPPKRLNSGEGFITAKAGAMGDLKVMYVCV